MDDKHPRSSKPSVRSSDRPKQTLTVFVCALVSALASALASVLA
jgi:hypothetical protein